jgi:hypothetical protein
MAAVVGLALWVSTACLDVWLGPRGVTRVALLPPWWSLAGLVGLALAAFAGATILLRRRFPRLAAERVFLPFLAVGLLALPYLPWLADAAPALRALAGPGRWLLWGIALAQVAWVAAAAVSRPRWARADEPLPSRVARVLPAAVFAAGAAVFGLAAARLAGPPLFPGGDEPHYLVMAQSAWRDHDLRIENNHRRGDYHEYFPGELKPDYRRRGADGQIYSIHPVGLPILIAPVYAAGRYAGVVVFQLLVAAAAAALGWWWTVRVTGSRGPATFAWAAVSLSAPYVFNSFTVYPEVPSALAVMVVLAVPRAGGAAWRWAACGLALAALPWLSTKYAPMAAVLALIAIWRIWRWSPRTGLKPCATPDISAAAQDTSADAPGVSAADRHRHVPASGAAPGVSAADRHRQVPTSAAPPAALSEMARHGAAAPRAGRRVLKPAAWVLVPFVLSLAGWFTYFYVTWGSPLPSVAYGPDVQTSLARALQGAPGLLLDQEHGVLAFAPVLLLGFTGLVSMWRVGGDTRRLAVELAAAGGTLLVTVGAFWIWWGGDAMPARPVVSGLLLLAPPIAWQYAGAASAPLRRAAHRLLLLVGLAVTASLALANGGMLLAQGRDGVSEFLRWLSPDWHLWALAPSFITQPLPVAAGIAGAWLAAASATGLLLGRLKVRAAGTAALTVTVLLASALVMLSLVVPAVFGAALAPDVRLEARSRAPALDRFDAAARPLAIVYDPWRRMAARRVPPMMSFAASPGLRRAPQPLPVLLDMRLALPAGDYTVRLEPREGASLEGSVGLQVGRLGPPLDRWDLSRPRGTAWTQSFTLDVDSSFVGLRQDRSLEARVASVEVRPLRIVDRSARPDRPEVLGAWRSPAGPVYFHDEGAYEEETGFWLRAESVVDITVVRKEHMAAALRVTAGPAAATLSVSVGGMPQRLILGPRQQADVPLGGTSRAAAVRFLTGPGFVPAEFDPSTHDQRHLCCRVSVVDSR